MNSATFYEFVTAFIPGPIIMGMLIDSTCKLWNTDECGEKGACLVYDLDAFRLKMHLYIAVIKLVACFLDVFVSRCVNLTSWYTYPRSTHFWYLDYMCPFTDLLQRTGYEIRSRNRWRNGHADRSHQKYGKRKRPYKFGSNQLNHVLAPFDQRSFFPRFFFVSFSEFTQIET